MGSNNVAPTANESRLGAMLNEIASIAYSADSLLNAGDSSPHVHGARLMLQTIGALADLGTKYSGSAHVQVSGDANSWLGITNFALPDEDAGHA